MAEYEGINGKANAALTTGIIGTAGVGAALLNGAVGGLFGGRNGWNGGSMPFVTKDELDYVQQIARKDSEIALLKSEQNTEIKIADVYERLITRINQDQRDQSAWNANQSVANAHMSSAIATNSNSIASLQHLCNDLTKVVIPARNICPQPMPMYNSWTAPTAAETPAGETN